MVRGFSTIPAVQSQHLHKRNGSIQLSIRALMIILVMAHGAFIHQVSSAASQTSASEGSEMRLFKSHHSPSVTPLPLPRVHRHFLTSGGRGAVRSSSHNADQAMRALVGSSPPKCIKKCGSCTPCKSVLVPIHTTNLPATPAEYYPEAWRCQCKGKLYNP